MEPAVLAVNPGSSSREYTLFRGETWLTSAYYEHSENGYLVTVENPNTSDYFEISAEVFDNSLKHFLELSTQRGIDLSEHLQAVGLRLVAPGRRFLKHSKLNPELHQYLQQNVSKAPLHLKIQLEQIDHLQRLLPEVPIYMISDSAFHHSLSHEARNYAIPADDADKYDIYRFGYHGLSIGSTVRTLRDELQLDYQRIVVCHLGSGSSITALKDWQSIDTSMGYSPLEGLVMATRSGNIDFEAGLEIKKQLGFSDEQMTEYLNKQSGLLGLSGTSNDIRQLIDHKDSGDYRATFALNAMVYRIHSYIGAYYAILGGLDAIVFTATVGERSSLMRQWICEPLAHLGIELDRTMNQSVDKTQQVISSEHSSVKIHAVPANEPAEIARQTIKLL